MKTGLRADALRLAVDAFDGRAYFKANSASFPKLPFPATELMPAVHTVFSTSPIRPMTNLESETDLTFSTLGFVRAQAGEDTEITKAELMDEIEETLRNLSQSAEFEAIPEFDDLQIDYIDPSISALTAFGLPVVILEQDTLVIRFDWRIQILYDVQDGG